MGAWPLHRLLRLVRLSSELTVQAVRQDCSFAKKRESPPALLVVVQGGVSRCASGALALMGSRTTAARVVGRT
jgi:hypothetical protein